MRDVSGKSDAYIREKKNTQGTGSTKLQPALEKTGSDPGAEDDEAWPLDGNSGT